MYCKNSIFSLSQVIDLLVLPLNFLHNLTETHIRRKILMCRP
jgi:hypothetical protein